MEKLLIQHLNEVLIKRTDEVVSNINLTKSQRIHMMLTLIMVRGLDLNLKNKKKNVYVDEKDTGSYDKASNITFETLVQNSEKLTEKFQSYLLDFSPNIQEILMNLEVSKLLENISKTILFQLLEGFIKYTSIDKNLDNSMVLQTSSNQGMESVFVEALKELHTTKEAQSTPKDIIQLMTCLAFSPLKNHQNDKKQYSLYDNTCGIGTILTEAQEVISKRNPNTQILLYGQEINKQSRAVCKAHMLLRGTDEKNIRYGSTLSEDQFKEEKFDFMFSNPPMEMPWGRDQRLLKVTTQSGKKVCPDPRFQKGIPRASDSQMLFLLDMISKMKQVTAEDPLGSTIVSIHSGASLFTGDAEQGESNIRKYIIEQDLLETIIQLPASMFYHTKIPTYIWLIRNNKAEDRKHKVQLIQASDEDFFCVQMEKSIGRKSNELSMKHIQQIMDLYSNFPENKHSKIISTKEFGYNQITIIKPKRVKELVQNEEFLKLTKHEEILKKLELLETEKMKVTNYDEFVEHIQVSLSSSEINLLLNTEQDKVPLTVDIPTYYQRNIQKFFPSSWIDPNTLIGYEVLFNNYFYEYTPPEPIKTLKKEIRELEKTTATSLENMLKNDGV